MPYESATIGSNDWTIFNDGGDKNSVVDISIAGTPVSSTAPFPVTAGSYSTIEVASFVRPANTTAYAIGDLVANSTTAGSVTPLSVTGARVANGTGSIVYAGLRKSN